MKGLTENRGRNVTAKSVIKEKMGVLNDFGICDKDDEEMKRKLEKAIADNPGKDPRRVLDYYCRPIIQKKVNSWI